MYTCAVSFRRPAFECGLRARQTAEGCSPLSCAQAGRSDPRAPHTLGPREMPLGMWGGLLLFSQLGPRRWRPLGFNQAFARSTSAARLVACSEAFCLLYVCAAARRFSLFLR